MKQQKIANVEIAKSPGSSVWNMPSDHTGWRFRLLGLERLLSLALLVLVVVGWELTAAYLIRPVWISSPSLVLRRLMVTLADGSLARDATRTMQEALAGLVVGVFLGAMVGVLLARVRLIARVLDPYLMGLNSLPRVALAPFFIIWFGLGLASKIALVITIVFFVAMLNVRQGMEAIDQDLIDSVRAMGADRLEMIRYVTIPSLLPWIVSAVKISIGMALIGAVIGEMIGAEFGLGWLVTTSLLMFDMTGAMTALLVMALMAVVMYTAVNLVERRLFRWRTGTTGIRTVSM
ncbi:MAG: ABC transporter permease [Candidatus Tectomicrobia bacterium]|uniref:ABC transporter permease n=1 Tax=Tectimicrobiota bacterium TaxID=2528274 RepID=A0A932GPS2_UNCTE|nr:ABC transporter permease [Candidatus Tectomicrobia bacterium]